MKSTQAASIDENQPHILKTPELSAAHNEYNKNATYQYMPTSNRCLTI